MKISEAIRQLQRIHAKFGDLQIVGGSMSDDAPLREIAVLNKDGVEIYPKEIERPGEGVVDGVFLS